MPEVRLFPLEGARRQDPSVQLWFSTLASDMRALAEPWFDEWRACGQDVEELLHDGHPSVCVQGVALGYVNAFAQHVNVGFFISATLPDPAGLLEGSGKFMRHVKIREANPKNEDDIRALIRAAYLDLKCRLAEPRHRPAA